VLLHRELDSDEQNMKRVTDLISRHPLSFQLALTPSDILKTEHRLGCVPTVLVVLSIVFTGSTITTVVSVGQGKPVSGAKVQVSAGGGRFLPSSDAPYDPKARLHGPYSVSGTSDREGRFVTWWVVNPAAPAYALEIRASTESQGEAQTNLKIFIKQ
jgi:hypothetical protein